MLVHQFSAARSLILSTGVCSLVTAYGGGEEQPIPIDLKIVANTAPRTSSRLQGAERGCAAGR
jgi:hypothetical protein